MARSQIMSLCKKEQIWGDEMSGQLKSRLFFHVQYEILLDIDEEFQYAVGYMDLESRGEKGAKDTYLGGSIGSI